jgi:hypothetical protein
LPHRQAREFLNTSPHSGVIVFLPVANPMPATPWIFNRLTGLMEPLIKILKRS